MKKFFAIISSEQFDILFRFGKIYHPIFLSSDGEDEKSLIEIFNSFIQFTYDENYLILEYNTTGDEEKTYHTIKIENIEKVFPISQECREALILKKSPQIRFENPFFSKSGYDTINKEYFISEANNGINILLKAFQFQNNTLLLSSEIISAVIKRRSGLKIGKLDNSATLTDFIFLYVYEAYYPLNSIGYMIRTVEILTRYKLAEKNTPYSTEILEKREIYQMLIELNSKDSNLYFDKLLEELEKDPRSQNFIKSLSFDNIKYYIVIPLFLKLIDEFNENGGHLEKTTIVKWIEKYNLNYNKECITLLVLLGAYLGYGNCYDLCYSLFNLKFFNSYKDKNSIENKSGELNVNDIIPVQQIEVNQYPENNRENKEITINSENTCEDLTNLENTNFNNLYDNENSNHLNNVRIKTKIEDENKTILSENKLKLLEFLPLNQLKLKAAGLNFVKSALQDSIIDNLGNEDKVRLFISKIENELNTAKKPKIKREDFEKIKRLLIENNI